MMINGNGLERKSSFRYLGVTIKENLSWKDHVDIIQTNQLAILRRNHREIKHLHAYRES